MLKYLALLSIALLHTANPQRIVTCAAGVFKEGGTASLTCLFPEYTAESRNESVVISKHELSASKDGTGTVIGNCHFTANDKPDCNTAGDFVMGNITTHSITVEIARVSSHHEGRYACRLVPEDNTTVYDCLLILEERKTWLNRHATTTITLLAIVMVMCCLVLYSVLAYRRKWFPFRIKTTDRWRNRRENAHVLHIVDPERTGLTTEADSGTLAKDDTTQDTISDAGDVIQKRKCHTR